MDSIVTGLISNSIQGMATSLVEEFCKIEGFKDTFGGLVDDLHTWMPMFQGFDDISSPDPALNTWLDKFRDWIKSAKLLIDDSINVNNTSLFDFSMIRIKREQTEHIKIVREDLSKLMVQVPFLMMRKLMLPQPKGSVYVQQWIPDELVSMDEQFQDIMEKLISPAAASSKKWVGIWGQGGSGKTIIARQVNNAAQVVNWFGGHILFVVIGEAANKMLVLRKLCKRVGCEFSEWDEDDHLQSLLLTAFHGKRVLLVLDDVWCASFLDLLDVVDGSKGSRIFVTTRNQQLLLQKHAEVVSAGLMSEEASRKLFYNHAFGVESLDCFQESVRGCADEIIRLCSGLPLALAIVGSAMAAKPKDLGQWRLAAQTIKEECLLPGCEMKGLFQFSYKQLKQKEQECFLTMLSFPEDYFIESPRLVAWWRGEGLIQPLSEYGWEEAEGILQTLVSRSMIQRDEKLDVIPAPGYWYRIHDVILELGLEHLLKDEHVLNEHERGHIFLSSPKHRERLLHYARTDLTKLRNVRKIAYGSNYRGRIQDDELRNQEEACQALLRMVEFPFLKTIVWMDIMVMDTMVGEALSRIVKNNSSLRVFMAIVSVFSKPPEKAERVTFEFCSDRLQTLYIDGDTSLNWGITSLPPNVRCLRLRGIDLHLGKPQHLQGLESFECRSGNAGRMLQISFKNLSSFHAYGYWTPGSSICMTELSNMKYLNALSDKVNVRWSSDGRPAHLPKLERLEWRVRDGDEEWKRMLFSACPNLTHLELWGSLGGMDSVQPPAPLEIMTLFHVITREKLMIFSTVRLADHGLWPLENPGYGSKFCCKFGVTQRLPRFASRLKNLPRIVDVDGVYTIHHSYESPTPLQWKFPGYPLTVLSVREFQTITVPRLPAIASHAAPQTLQDVTISGFTVSETQAAALNQLQHLEKLDLRFEGPLPQSLIGLPGAFSQLRELGLTGKLEEFPKVGQGSLPKLQEMDLCSEDYISLMTELVIGGTVSDSFFKFEKLQRLYCSPINFKLLPVEVLTGPSFRELYLYNFVKLEKLVVEPEAEPIVARSTLKSLEISNCERMTVAGIPEVFKIMDQRGQSTISSRFLIFF